MCQCTLSANITLTLWQLYQLPKNHSSTPCIKPGLLFIHKVQCFEGTYVATYTLLKSLKSVK